MADNKPFHQLTEATSDLVNSFRETNQTTANGVMIIQERNVRFAQNLLSSWTELLTYQVHSIGSLMQQWEHQTQKQQEAFQRLASASMQMSLDFLFAPLSVSGLTVKASWQLDQTSQQTVDAATTTMQREFEQTQPQIPPTFPEAF